MWQRRQISALRVINSLMYPLYWLRELVDDFRSRTMALTSLAGIGGLPQITIPIGILDNCPIGLSLIGWAGADETLLDLAVALAPYCGTAHQSR